MSGILQLVGAILILTAFVGSMRGAMSPRSLVYLSLNLAGTVTLSAVALAAEDWGFLLLNGVWAIISTSSLINLARGRPTQTLEP